MQRGRVFPRSHRQRVIRLIPACRANRLRDIPASARNCCRYGPIIFIPTLAYAIIDCATIFVAGFTVPNSHSSGIPSIPEFRDGRLQTDGWCENADPAGSRDEIAQGSGRNGWRHPVPVNHETATKIHKIHKRHKTVYPPFVSLVLFRGQGIPGSLRSDAACYSCAQTDLTCVYRSSTSWPISRPQPDCL